MSSIRGTAKPLESALSVCLLAILALIGVAILSTQSDVDMDRFGIQTTSAGPSTLEGQIGEAEPRDLNSLEPSGFEAFSETETYTAENLYEKINGKAPLYIDSGFKGLRTQRFMSRDKEDLWMELYIYDMTNTRNAFSVYSMQRRTDAQIIPLFEPASGYGTGNALYFVHGPYYVEVIGSAESDELSGAMAEICRRIRTKLVFKDDTEILELNLFPSRNLVPGSVKLYLTDAFGFERLTDTFAAKYRFGDETITAFLSKRPSADEAVEVLEKYTKFLLDNGGTLIPTANPQVRFVDFYGTLEIVFVTGPFLFGIHEAENRELAEEVEEMILS
ncbi:MAG: DUF6599 family protein [Planctomycetota bacterium]|jgi:hypothetical protein